MKLLPGNNAKANWEGRLLKDLAFIKQRGRYPVSRRTLIPSAFIIFIVLFALRLIFPVFLLSKATGIVWLMVPFAALLIGIAIYQYYRMLTFRRIPTTFYVQDNQAIIQKFFESQHLAYTRHPEAPEVFMILSKNLSMRGDYREVMIFITDDKQILVNSHFSGDKMSFTPPSKQYNQMANRLRDWLNIYISKNNTTAVSFSNI